MQKEVIETPFAWLERISPYIIMQRWKEEVTLNVPTIRATMELRTEYFGRTPHAVLVVVPTGTLYAMNFLENDQYKNTTAATDLFAMANVIEDVSVQAVVSLYYAQHPPPYLFGVFDNHASAMDWLNERVKEKGLET